MLKGCAFLVHGGVPLLPYLSKREEFRSRLENLLEVPEFLERVRSLVHATARHYGELESAEDVLQDTLLSLFTRKSDAAFENEDQILHYVRAIARRFTLAVSRKRSDREISLGDDAFNIPSEVQEEVVGDVDFRELLHEARESLSDIDRTILEMWLGGHSVGDMAKKIAISRQSVERRRQLIRYRLLEWVRRRRDPAR